MALPIVIAKNQTASPIPLARLGLTLPPTPASFTLSDYASFYEISADPDLNAQVNSGVIVINDGTSDLTAAVGDAYLDATGNFNGPTGSLAANTLLRLSGTSGRYAKSTSVTVDDSNNLTTTGSTSSAKVILTNSAADPTSVGEVTLNGTDLKGRDGSGVFNLRSGAGLTEAQHKALRQLIHFIDEGPAEGFASGAYKEIVGGAFPTSVIWYEDATKTQKIVEKTITRSGGGATNVAPTPIVWKVYDVDGTTVLATVSDAITYSSSVFESTRTRTIS